MDTTGKRRRRWAAEEKRRIAEESFEGNSSVAQLGQKYAVNANQIFLWRRQYREGRLENRASINLVSRQNSIPVENGAFLPASQREESELDQKLR